MINLAVPQQPPPTLPRASELETLNALLKLLADPQATQSRLTAYVGELTSARDRYAADLATLTATHEKQLAEARNAHDEACRQREEAAAAIEAKAKTDAAEAERVRAEVERRRAALDAAAAEVGRDLPGAR